jgi:hypothetical protein
MGYVPGVPLLPYVLKYPKKLNGLLMFSLFELIFAKNIFNFLKKLIGFFYVRNCLHALKNLENTSLTELAQKSQNFAKIRFLG